MSGSTNAKMGGRRGIRSVHSIPGALANQQKYTGQEHRVVRTKKAGTGKTSGAWLETEKKKRYKRKT